MRQKIKNGEEIIWGRGELYVTERQVANRETSGMLPSNCIFVSDRI